MTYSGKFSDPVYKEGSVAWVLQRYIDDMAQLGKALGPSQAYNLAVLQRSAIGAKRQADVTKGDVIETMKALKAGTYASKKPLHPATVMQYFNGWRVAVKNVASAFDDCASLTIAPFLDAQAYLQKHNLIGKASRRTRRPTDEEITALLNYYATPNKRGKARQIRMPDMIAFALASARRIGEICRITHGDVDYANKVYWVRDCKHPTKKKGNHKRFVLFPELEIIVRRQPRTGTHPDERIFPFNAHSASASYTNAKKHLGIDDLHFHDCRGDAISRWLIKLGSAGDVRLMVSGHDNEKVLTDHYDRRDPLEILRAKYADLVQPAA